MGSGDENVPFGGGETYFSQGFSQGKCLGKIKQNKLFSPVDGLLVTLIRPYKNVKESINWKLVR